MSGAAAIFAAPIAAAVVGGLTYATVAPASNFWGKVIARGPVGLRRVALTFDDGPTPGATEAILDLLRDAGAPASFFVIGANVHRHGNLLRRIHDEGHLIANHSFNHSHYGVFRREGYWMREIMQTDDAIAAVLGVRPAMYRPPVGVRTWHTASAARRAGHQMITWSRRAVDGLPTTSQRIMHRFARIEDGEILLLHDGVEPNTTHADRSATIAALPMLLQQLRRGDLTPVRLDVLLGIPAYQSAGVTDAVGAPAT